MNNSTGQPRSRSEWLTIEERSDMTDPLNHSESPWRRRRKRMRTSTHKTAAECSIHDCSDEPMRSNFMSSGLNPSIRLCREHLFEAIAMGGHLFSTKLMTQIAENSHAETLKSFARAEAEDRANTFNRQPGWIYYIQVGDLLKIGYAKIVWDRLMSYPPNITVLAIHPGTRELETYLHRKFRLLLQKGREWYADDGTIADHIIKVREEFGSPSDQIPGFGMDYCPWDVAA